MPSERAEIARAIADHVATLLNRNFRSGLYGELTAGLSEAVDPATYPVISGLARSGPSTAAELAAVIGIDRSVVSRHASRLEQAGLVARGAHPHDKRATVLTLTERGAEVVTTMRARLHKQFERAFAGAPEHLMRDTRDGLAHLIAAFEQ